MLITDYYRRIIEHEHSTSEWGVTGWAHAPQVHQLIRKEGIKTLLDYGAGRGSLGHWFDQNDPNCVERREYEPGIPKLNKDPQPAELVACIDVMEHVEADCVSAVLDHIQGLAQKWVYFNISTRPAGRILKDGRNAHITLMSEKQWLDLLEQRWKVVRHLSGDKCFTWIGNKY